MDDYERSHRCVISMSGRLVPSPAAWVLHPYDGCLQKVARAREHRETLAALCQQWLGSEIHELLVEREEDSATWRYRLPELPPPPVVVGAIVSDVIAQLRSTLDQLAAYLVETRGNAARIADAKFPVCWDAADWPAAARKALPGVTGPVLDLLAEAQPFAADRHRVLWLLAQASNRDKHRYMLPVVSIATREPVIVGWDPGEQANVVDVRPAVSIGELLAPGQLLAEVVMASADLDPPTPRLTLIAAAAFGTTSDGGHGLTTADLRLAADIIESLIRRLFEFDSQPETT